MGEQSQGVIRMIFHLASKTGKEVVADLDAARRRVRRRLVDDRAHAAEIDVAIVGDELQRGRRDVDRDVLLHHGLVAAPKRGVARGDAQHGGTFLHTRHLCQRHRDLFLAHRLGELLGGEIPLGAVLRQRRLDGLQARPLVGDLDLRRRHADHVDIGRDDDLRRLGFKARSQE